MSTGVRSGDKHTFDDWGLSLMSIEISEPETITHIIEIPGRRTPLDLTEAVYGEPTFKNRTIKMTFIQDRNRYSSWHGLDSEIRNHCHGRRMQIILDTDPAWYWIGRISVASSKDMVWLTKFEITASVEPYKYAVLSTLDDWRWDSFSFRTGVIRNYKNLSIPESKVITVIGSPVPVTPKIKVSKAMTLVVAGKSFSLAANVWRQLTGVKVGREPTLFAFTDTGIVSIEFREESL